MYYKHMINFVSLFSLCDNMLYTLFLFV